MDVYALSSLDAKISTNNNHGSQISCANAQVTGFLLNLTSSGPLSYINQFGKYKCLRLLMGLICSPHIAQSIMESVLAVSMMQMYTLMTLVPSPLIGISMSNCSATYYTICKKFSVVNGPSKKLTGLLLHHSKMSKTLEEKIDAIPHMDCPQNASELCMFISSVNYY
ncbi:hypothetical protein ACHAW6_004897 [Cyclotella cf. meneghiniana]